MGKVSQAKYHGVPGDFEGQCEASNTKGTRRCKRHAKPGSNVCETHGSRAPQVKAAARIRLAALVDPAIGKLAGILKAKKNDPHITVQQQLAAAKDVLDRNGYKAKDEILLTAELDTSRFKDFSEDELKTFIMLARRASTMKDATDATSSEDE